MYDEGNQSNLSELPDQCAAWRNRWRVGGGDQHQSYPENGEADAVLYDGKHDVQDGNQRLFSCGILTADDVRLR
jgi:hypothetical protein